MLRRLRQLLGTRHGQVGVGLLGLMMGAAILALTGFTAVALAATAVGLGLGLLLLADAHKKLAILLSLTRRAERSGAASARAMTDAMSNQTAHLEAVFRDSASDLRVLREQVLVRLDVLERTVSRIEGEHERTTGALDELLTRSAKQSEALEGTSGSLDQLRLDQKKLADASISEIDALNQVHARAPILGRVPLLSGWALSPRAILSVFDVIEETGPRMIVECGSGASTVFIASLLGQLGSSARFVSLEHHPEFAAQTTAQLEAHGLRQWAELRVAPLEPVDLDGRIFHWYGPEAFEDLTDIDLLIIDGPPKSTGRHARYPALPAMLPRLSDRAYIMLDDAARPDEKTIVKRWLDLANLEKQEGLTRDMAILRRVPAEQVEHPTT